MDITVKEFHKSINNELHAVKNRVRQLIGEANWGDEGRYKEAILRNTIKNFLPSNLGIGTGFIIKNNNYTGNIDSSKQIDIIIYDENYPLPFREADFIITTPEAVKAIIEVKTRVQKSKLSYVMENINYNSTFLNPNTFSGLFSYENSIAKNDIENLSEMDELLKNSAGKLNHIALGEHIFIKYWDESERITSLHYSIYNLKKMAFTYFLSNLLESISTTDLRDRWWFMYPIEEGKEQHLIRKIMMPY